MAVHCIEKKTEAELRKITDEVVKRILENTPLRVNKIILYGSYARGDAEDGSDIDIMVLCDNNKEEANKHFKEIFEIADKVAFENDIMIQTNVENESFFNNWIDDLPYYKNVKNEGVLLYGE